jgi:PAS domain S-box-containing protein
MQEDPHTPDDTVLGEGLARLLAEPIPMGILVTNLDGDVLGANQAFLEMAGGYSEEEMLSMSIENLYADPSSRADTIEMLLEISVVPALEIELKTKDGTKKWASITCVLQTAPGGGSIIVGYGRDITEFKRVAEELRRSEEMFRAITATANDAIMLVEGEGTLVYLNQAAENLFGYTALEAVGRKIHELLSPDEMRADYSSRVGEFSRNGTGRVIGTSHEFIARKKGGTLVPVEVSGSSILLDGKWNAMLAARDIRGPAPGQRAAGGDPGRPA